MSSVPPPPPPRADSPSRPAGPAYALGGGQFTLTPQGMRLDMIGQGASIHQGTGDRTEWGDVKCTIELAWGESCRLVAWGSSVLSRQCMGATLALQHMAMEVSEEERVAALAHHAVLVESFSGHAFRLGDGAARIEPSPARRALAETVLTAASNRVFREYGCDASDVAVPFVLNGNISLKSGAVTMAKTHVSRYVNNSISYNGDLILCCLKEDGAEHQMPISDFMVLMEQLARGEPTIQLTRVLFRVHSDFSYGIVELRPMQTPLEEAVVVPASVAAAANVSPASIAMPPTAASPSPSVATPSNASVATSPAPATAAGSPSPAPTTAVASPSPSPSPSPSSVGDASVQPLDSDVEMACDEAESPPSLTSNSSLSSTSRSHKHRRSASEEAPRRVTRTMDHE